ncbi:hypothetical protein [Actinomadura nitritigenes]|uniref:hypothetical protein n=1 Tax=Actinomadura nitritigenes TaxID=134602 RepID=UPI003D944FD5
MPDITEPFRLPFPWRTRFAPPPRQPFFTGRDAELAAAFSTLLARGRVLVGCDPDLPRAGKTWFATEFVHRFQCRFEHVAWVDCVPPDGEPPEGDGWEEGFTDACQVETAAGCESLDRPPGTRGRLLVLDGLRTPGLAVGRFSGACAPLLLVTSCAADPGWRDSTVTLGRFKPHESVRLLNRATGLSPDQALSMAGSLGNRPETLMGKAEKLVAEGLLPAAWAGDGAVEPAKASRLTARETEELVRVLKHLQIFEFRLATKIWFGSVFQPEPVPDPSADGTGRGPLMQLLERVVDRVGRDPTPRAMERMVAGALALTPQDPAVGSLVEIVEGLAVRWDRPAE